MVPKVTALMSVHNGEAYLRESVRSILGQSFVDFEFLIIDDASTDGTPAILVELARADDRIRIHTNEENLGLTRSLNVGLDLAQGAYVARQDADDISLPDRLEVQNAVLDAHPEVVLVSGRVEQIDSEGRITGKLRASRPAANELIPWMLLFYNYLQGHSVAMFRREAALRLGGYNEAFRTSQDYELWLRMSRTGGIEIPERLLLQLRVHRESISKRSRDTQKETGLRCSQQAIEALSGRRLSTDEVQELRNFWKGHFGKCESPGRIHAALIGIYEAYAMRGAIGDAPPPPATLAAIRRLVRKQFNLWQRRTRLRHAPMLKLRAGLYASRWHD